eukprot:CAMPEP_0206184856 /NCGR_PEP_ID=MMETSP0166-20121206/1458_1 /ASSEMBLY_ACC=CAM_ASM_000260 /TAXON_ID=95228 /ORGANISM="Vannella robusta, Strain DIVA3 518/3/11/1/6" /LENGTH=104 /DNA_ID=CAMNT_0053599933 /DNA_START=1384 /DNA_END=1695 /DNA_ORIENTATION=-
MAGATRAMTAANAQVDMNSIQKTAMQFQQQSEYMEMADEMLDDMFDEDEDDEETDSVLQSVFDDIGLDLAGQMKSVPQNQLPQRSTETELTPNTEDAELNNLIA